MGREGAAAPAGLELQLGRGAWRAAARRTGRPRGERRGAGGAKGEEMGCGAEGPRCGVEIWIFHIYLLVTLNLYIF